MVLYIAYQMECKCMYIITREDIQELAEKIFKNPPIYTIVASQDTLNVNKEYLTSLEQA